MVSCTIFFLFLPLLAWCKNNLIGLQNYGETCYANAVFQLLYHNRDFRGSLEKYLSRDQMFQNQNLCALNNIFLQIDRSDGPAVYPETFKALPDTFEPKTQYDVAEVLQYYQSVPEFDWSPFTIEIQKNSEVFSEYFLELFLNVPEVKIFHLEELLGNHFFEGGKRIKRLPDNLIVRIKRVHTVAGIDQKITDHILVPEQISLHPFCVEAHESLPPSFRLEAFIEHCGTCVSGGHYLLYLHHNDSGKYYAISDEKVQEITRWNYLDKAARAYLLLFKPEL